MMMGIQLELQQVLIVLVTAAPGDDRELHSLTRVYLQGLDV